MKPGILLHLEKVTVKLGGQTVLRTIDLTIQKGEQWAITGPSGSGKTVLAHTIAGRHFFSGTLIAGFATPETYHHSVMVVEQQHRFKDVTNQSDFYYQQRYNSFDAERTVTAGQLLSETLSNQTDPGINQWIQLLQIDHLMDEPLIQLSNGENKRLQLALALLQHPQLLILDNPFLGLDVQGRKALHEILLQLSNTGLSLLVITTPTEIPDCITHIATLESGVLSEGIPKKSFPPPGPVSPVILLQAEQLKNIPVVQHEGFETPIRMKNVTIRYDGKTVLDNINWEVKKGERWSVSGPNGAGKSTLLSLLTGDNPQAYSNEIWLFDKKRGTGESIWDIKKRIGYVSPEMHLYFDYTATAFHAIASGLFDTIGLFRQLNADQEALVFQWIDLLQLNKVAHKLLKQLSSGEQRLVLLARALVKSPPLLILDEPCQGLDDVHVAMFRELVNTVCTGMSSTLIYVSHYKEEIPAVVTRHLQLEKGKGTIMERQG